jgi:PAS domain S-box-containing protein
MGRVRMLLEGEVNWVLVLGVIAGIMTLLAAYASWFALTHRSRVVTKTGELDVVQKVAASADKRLFETMNAIPVALVETDTQGKFVFANRAAHQLLGRRDAELIGLRFHSATWGITFPDGRTIPADMLPSARALRGQTVRGFQHIMANPATRRKMLVSVTAMPIEDEWGQVIGSTAAIVETEGLTTPEPQPPIVETVFDPAHTITRQVFEVAASALVVVSPHGEILLANRVALDLIGAADCTGADFAERFVEPDARVEARQALWAAFKAPAGDAEPLMTPAPDGGRLRWTILPLAGSDGAPESLLLAGEAAPVEPSASGVPVDPALEQLARERDQALEQLRASRAEAETALAEVERVSDIVRAENDAGRRLEGIGRITGGVAQDFNALLGVMTTALDMMLKQADDPSRVRRLGEAALAAGRRGEVVTQRLSAFTRENDNEVRTLDAGILLRAMESRLRALVGPGVDLLIEGPSGSAPVRLDPVAFEGAIKALVANAVEAVGAKGSIAVRLEATDGGARLSVRDSGPGMDRDVAARASEPFFTTKQGAAGLGLAQAQAFARQSGGTLLIDSTPGEGAEVAVILPSLAA